MCHRFSDIVIELCSPDSDFEVHIRSDPHVPPPPASPPHIPYAFTSVAREFANTSRIHVRGSAANLNARFTAASNDPASGNELFNLGLLIHQFDFMVGNQSAASPCSRPLRRLLLLLLLLTSSIISRPHPPVCPPQLLLTALGQLTPLSGR